jgi:valyl-tRNA synthetase
MPLLVAGGGADIAAFAPILQALGKLSEVQIVDAWRRLPWSVKPA